MIQNRTADFLSRYGSDVLVPTFGAPSSKLLLMGHWLYCRRLKQPPVMVQTPTGTKEIVIPEKAHGTTAMPCNWLKVLAIGPEVGKKRTWSKTKMEGMRVPYRWLSPDSFAVGDSILCPQSHEGLITHSPTDPDELLIDESVPIAVSKESE